MGEIVVPGMMCGRCQSSRAVCGDEFVLEKYTRSVTDIVSSMR